MTPTASLTSDYPGVHLNGDRPRCWRVQMMHRGRRLHLGYFRRERDTAETARLARELLPVRGGVRLPPVAGLSARRSSALRSALVVRLVAYGLSSEAAR
jgi:hypothetical protein